MSYSPTYLSYWTPPPGSEHPSPPASLAEERVEDASRVWGHAILVGEILGIDMDEVQAELDGIYGLPDDLPWLFLEESMTLLRKALALLLKSLGHAIEDGRPIGEGGARLAASPHIVERPDGRLQVSTTSFALDELQSRLEAIDRMLQYALDHGLLVVERYAGSDERAA